MLILFNLDTKHPLWCTNHKYTVFNQSPVTHNKLLVNVFWRLVPAPRLNHQHKKGKNRNSAYRYDGDLPIYINNLQMYIKHVKCRLSKTLKTVFKVLGYKTQVKKGKAVPLKAWSDPEGSRNLRFPDFMTTAQDGGKVVSLTHRPPLPPGNTPGTHFC